jgi:aryl-phospho-beta-D-glucosidase BglC (GH1 family)
MNNILKKLILFFCIILPTIQLPAMTTEQDKIVNSDGEVIELKGVNWFGFNNQQTMVDGLWDSHPLKKDFALIVHRMKGLGFNAVRLPFSFKDLYSVQPRRFNVPCSSLPSLADIQSSITPPFYQNHGNTIPPLASPPDRSSGQCNGYLPNDSTFNRFVWVVDFFARNGFYVLIDNHLREDQTALENPDLWVHQWVELVTAIEASPAARGRLMIDLLNEPDNYGLRWESTDSRMGLGDYYLKAMDAIYAVNPSALFMIEGTGQSGLNANWGDGFATDPQLIAQKGLSDPNPFFTKLIDKPYVNQVVISPHIYPPSVTHAGSDFSGADLAGRLTDSFGYLTKQGYCTNSQCHIFPVAVGEFGSKFDDAKDRLSMNDIARYFNNQGALNDGKHMPITDWFYWSWNANSGDTGGIVTDDWLTIQWNKIDYLKTVGLRPWYSEDSMK